MNNMENVLIDNLYKMNMIFYNDIFLIYIAAIGFTIAFVYSSLFERFGNLVKRNSDFLGEMISCPLCFGFWSGIIFGFLYNIDPILLGFSTSILSWLVSNIANMCASISSFADQLEYINGIKHGLFDEEKDDEQI